MRFGAVALVAVAVAALTAGCGGSGDAATGSSAGGPGALSKAEYVKRANAICARGHRQVQSRAGARDVGEAVLPVLQRMIDEVARVGTPAGERREVYAYVLTFQDEIHTNEAHRFGSLAQLEQIFAPSAPKASALGIAGCAFG
jgi:hypothetical protein